MRSLSLVTITTLIKLTGWLIRCRHEILLWQFWRRGMWCPLKGLMAPRNTNRPHFLFSSLEWMYLTLFCQIRKAASPGISFLHCVCRKKSEESGQESLFLGLGRVHGRHSFPKIVVSLLPSLKSKDTAHNGTSECNLHRQKINSCKPSLKDVLFYLPKLLLLSLQNHSPSALPS